MNTALLKERVVSQKRLIRALLIFNAITLLHLILLLFITTGGL